MILLLFAIIFLGILLGKLEICGVRIGLAGVLVSSILVGWILNRFFVSYNGTILAICQFLSNFGMALFIAVIGIQSGKMISFSQWNRQWRAFVGGMGIVLIGGFVIFGCGTMAPSVPRDLLLGIFAGSMTSTSAMSAASEIYGITSSVSLGYGISYCIGLISVVLFVQFPRFSFPDIENQQRSLENESPQKCKQSQNNSLIMLSGAIIIGLIISKLLPIGTTGGILLSSFFVGVIYRKKEKSLVDFKAYKTLGLLLFFIGNGISAGSFMMNGIHLQYLFYGALVSFVSLFVGFCFVHFVLRFSISEALIVLCGGMTSTPAIGVIQERDRSVDLTLYTTSYWGALVALLGVVQILTKIWS
jgi:putative transport protein